MKRLQLCQCTVFILGWMAYASTYLLRKPIGVLGWFDISLLLPYAVAQILLGSTGDYFGSRKTLSACLLMSGISMITFGQWSSVTMLCILLFINGLAQCWPNVTSILSSWFSDKQKNTVFGFFGTCAFAGGIIGTALAVHLNSKYGWRGAHVLPSVIVIVMSLLCFIGYKEKKEVMTEHEPDTEAEAGVKPASTPTDGTKLGLKDLAWLPGVIEISVAVFCLKLVRYCMYMWLPMFLEKQLSYKVTEAGLFSTMFEIGGVAGSAVLGLILDRYSSSRPLVGVTITVILSAIALVLFQITSGWGYAVNSACMLLAGAFNCGPDTILGAAIPNKIGQQDNRNCGSAVTGIVNGFGSLGTIIEGPIIAWISATYGWTHMFTMMVALTVMGALATTKASLLLDNKK